MVCLHMLPVSHHLGSRRDKLSEQRAVDISLFDVTGSASSRADKDDELVGKVPLHGDDPRDISDIDPGCPNVSSRDVNEADNAVRKHYRIKVSGYDPAPPLRSFQQLVTKHSVPTGLVRILHESGFDQPTPIQRQAVPALLAGRELLAVAPTGSGKTLVRHSVMVKKHSYSVATWSGVISDAH